MICSKFINNRFTTPSMLVTVQRFSFRLSERNASALGVTPLHRCQSCSTSVRARQLLRNQHSKAEKQRRSFCICVSSPRAHLWSRESETRHWDYQWSEVIVVQLNTATKIEVCIKFAGCLFHQMNWANNWKSADLAVDKQKSGCGSASPRR